MLLKDDFKDEVAKIKHFVDTYVKYRVIESSVLGKNHR